MTSKERLRAALLGEAVDHVPFSPNLAYLFESLPQDLRDLGHMGFSRMVGADLLHRFSPCPVRRIDSPDIRRRSFREGDLEVDEVETPVGRLRQGHRYSEQGDTRFMTEHMFKCEDDYKTYMWIEERVRYELDLEPVEACFAAEPDALHVGMLMAGRCKTGFQMMVEHFVGTEKLAYDLADFPDTVEALLDLMAQKGLEAVRLACESPYEFFITWEDSSTQNYSPAMYEAYIAPEIRQWCERLASADKHYIQHACGHLKALLPIMNTHGLCAVESLSPAPTGDVTLAGARRLLDPAVGIVGGIEPTQLLNLTLEELGPYVEQVIDDAAGGPFVLANSDSCPPGVSVAKFKLIAEIARSR